VFALKTSTKTSPRSTWIPAFAGKVGGWGLMALVTATAAHAADRPVIAMTWDDLPAHSALPPGVTRVQVAADLLKAFAAAKAPAFGFVNGVQTARERSATAEAPSRKRFSRSAMAAMSPLAMQRAYGSLKA